MRVLFVSLLLFSASILAAQARLFDLHGQVLRPDRTPVPFATISGAGWRHPVQADAHGHFVLRTYKGESFVIAAKGYFLLRFRVASDTAAVLFLQPTDRQLRAERREARRLRRQQ